MSNEKDPASPPRYLQRLLRHFDDNDSSLRLRTLGAVGLYEAATDDLVLGEGKPLALIVFLALAPGRRTSRESLTDLFWSDATPERARASLRQTVFLLRRMLGETAIVGTDELTLNCGILSDRDQFLAALEADNLEEATALYAGEFLPAFAVPGAARFEHWADLERDRLEAGFLRAVEILVRRHLNHSRVKDARQLARRARELLPHVEAAARLAIETSIAGKDFITAAMEANALEEVASSEHVALEPATRTVIARARRIGATDDTVDRESDPTVLVAELTGREREFFAITSAWDAVRKGPSQHLHLNSRPGIGKTRLLRDAIARLVAGGARVVQLRASPADRDVPFAFLADLAAAVATLPGAVGIAPASASTLVALNPSLSATYSTAADSAIGDDAFRRRIHALTELVHAVSHEQRFVLAIDDLHWVDGQSFRVLEALWSRLDAAHILTLTASRPERTPASEHCVTLHLPALDLLQVGALVSALGAVPVNESWCAVFVDNLHKATNGSPLLVLQTLSLALDQAVLALDQGEWRCLHAEKLSSLLRAGEAVRERVRGLSPPQLSLLALLATVGSAIGRADAARMSTANEAELDSSFQSLERLGMITMTGSGWIPTHDEISDAARRCVATDERETLERRVGIFLTQRAGVEPSAIMRAARHLVAAGDMHLVRHLFREFVLVGRMRGDRRSFAAIATEFVGIDGEIVSIELTNSLPWLWRIGLWSSARRWVSAAALLLVPALAFGVEQARAANNSIRQRLFFVDSAKQTVSATARVDEFDGRQREVSLSITKSVLGEIASRYHELPPAVSPDGKSVAWIQDAGDSTSLDIWIRTPSGSKRLTTEFRDDLVYEWLPDGSALIGTSNRWSPRGDGDYDIAVFDTATGNARQITHGKAHDTAAHVSPDGTRVAFLRQSDSLPQRLCLIGIDGEGEPECRLLDGQKIAMFPGWSSLSELVFTVDGPKLNQVGVAPGRFVVYDWPRNVARTLMQGHARDARLSPDRQWAAVTMVIPGLQGAHEWIVPLQNPTNARRVESSRYSVGVVRWWEGAHDQSLLIDHLEFTDTSSTLPLGAGTQVRVRALTRNRAEIPLLVGVRWVSSDTLIALIDSAGIVRPRSSGDVQVSAQVAGIRVAVKKFHVRGAVAVTVLNEQWDPDWKNRWIPWGDPQPFVSTGPDHVQGFFNNGDGNQVSVGVSRRAINARQGLGIEVRISSPLNRGKWQRVVAAFVSQIDTSALLAADQHKEPPTVVASMERSCGMDFPIDGAIGRTQMAVAAGTSEITDLGAGATALRNGTWWTLRLQIFPDGRCGVAVNNHVVWLSSESISLEHDFRVRIGDNSNGTRIVHGPLQVWTGVRTDIQWTP